MSIPAYNWAWKQPIKNPTTKLVLLALANHVNPQGECCWPETKRLAEHCGITRRSIRRHLERLETDGLLRKHMRFKESGKNNSNMYYLLMGGNRKADVSDMGDVGDMDDTGGIGRVTPASGKGDTDYTHRGTPASTKSLSESSKNLKRNTSASVSLSSFEEFYKSYPKKRNRDAALKEWEKLNPDESLVAIILADVATRQKSTEWTNHSGQYVPYPVRYLQDRRWEDELVNANNEEDAKDYSYWGEGPPRA